MTESDAFRASVQIEPELGRLAAALRALPPVDPPHSTLPALTQAFRAVRRPVRGAGRRPRWAMAAAAGLVALVAAGLWTLQRPAPAESVARTDAPTPAAADPAAGNDAVRAALLAQLVAQNQAYETVLRAPGLSAVPTSAGMVLAEGQLGDLIGMVDLALAASTDPDAQTELWARRLALLRELTALRAGGVEPGATLARSDSGHDAPWLLY